MMKAAREPYDPPLLVEANRLRQVVEHLHALVNSQLGAAETVRKAQLVLNEAVRNAMDFPPAINPSPRHDPPPQPEKGDKGEDG